ncbi:MAG: (2Fe-2S)-binding protein [Sphingomonadales bacterium]
MTHTITFTLNGEQTTATVTPNHLAVDLLRDDLGKTGTHVGCDTSQCGACTLHLNGEPIKSCTLLAVQLDGTEITTIEGLAKNGDLHPMQAAFKEHHGLQCGFCTPGMIMSGIGIAQRNTTPDDATIRHELEGNICRCTGYQNIVTAIREGAKAMAEV